MISLKVEDVKGFMSSLLVHNVFDTFLLSEMTIHTGTELYLSGKLNEAFYSTEELEQLNGRKYATWAEQKGIAFSYIKGSKLPLSIKIVFLLSERNANSILNKAGNSLNLNDVNGLFVNIRYEQGIIYVTTGTSLKIFTMDKSLERTWDEELSNFLKKNSIPCSESD